MKDKSVFNLTQQQEDLPSKIVTALERVSQAFKALLWEKAKKLGLSPIQIQILVFIANHKSEYNNVSYLANEFNVTKPTLSDAIKVLAKKELIEKDYSSSDNRSYTVFLTDLGKQTLKETEDFVNPLTESLKTITPKDQESFFNTLSKVVYQLNQKGVLTVQRTCFACKYYQKNKETHYCNLLDSELLNKELRIDCEEFEGK